MVKPMRMHEQALTTGSATSPCNLRSNFDIVEHRILDAHEHHWWLRYTTTICFALHTSPRRAPFD
jgi:hypothetical protein